MIYYQRNTISAPTTQFQQRGSYCICMPASTSDPCVGASRWKADAAGLLTESAAIDCSLTGVKGRDDVLPTIVVGQYVMICPILVGKQEGLQNAG